MTDHVLSEGGPGQGPADPGTPGLPEAAARRLSGGAWSSGLSVADFASCVAMGMDPVGFVQGYAVMQWGWYSGTFFRTPGGLRTPLLGVGGMPGPTAAGQYSEGWQCPHGFVGGEHRVYGYNYEQTWVEQSWSTGWGLALSRMVDEARSLGAHGVIGVADDMRHLPGGSAVEFSIRGTAVVVDGGTPPPQPFTTFLAGRRLVKLIEAGFAPVSVAAAMSSVQMVASCITHYQLAGTSTGGAWSGGMSGGTAGVNSIVQVGKAQRAARHLAREHVRDQLGDDVLHGASLQRFEHEAGEGDMSVECVIRGTRVRQFKDFDPIPEAEPVVRLV